MSNYMFTCVKDDGNIIDILVKDSPESRKINAGSSLGLKNGKSYTVIKVTKTSKNNLTKSNI